MDPIWKNLPIDLVYKICNMLPKVRRISDDLKRNIEFQEMFLLNFYKSSRPLFRAHTWVFVHNSLSTYIRQSELFPIDYEWNPREECYYLWYRMTPEQRLEFVRGDHF